MATQTVKKPGPVYVTRIYHVGAQKYLYAKDYGIKAFPLGRR